jgi:hypothetical protein
VKASQGARRRIDAGALARLDLDSALLEPDSGEVVHNPNVVACRRQFALSRSSRPRPGFEAHGSCRLAVV